jgi:hypothetical protein
MNKQPHPLSADFTPRDWIARWVVSLTTPHYSLRTRLQIEDNMRAFARRMPDYHAVIMGGVLHELVVCFDPRDPFRNLYRDHTGVIRLPGGEALGSSHNAVDLTPASNRDVARDVALAPMAEPLSDSSVELYFHASRSWEDARRFLIAHANRDGAGEVQQNAFEVAEDAIRWALLRRKAYGLDGDSFVSVTAIAWAKRASVIVAGEPFDEARMLRLRSGAAILPGSYDDLTSTDKGDLELPSDDVGDEEETP